MNTSPQSPCSECAGRVRRKTVTQQFEKEGVKVKLSGFEAWACERRGEIYFEPGGGEKVARAVNCLFALALGERRHKGRVSANLS